MQTILSTKLTSVGLDSLTAIDFIEHIHSYFKSESSKEKFNLANLFEFETLDKLAQSIQATQKQELTNIKNEEKNLTPIQIIKTNTKQKPSLVFSKKMIRHQKLIHNLHKIPNLSSQYRKLKKSDTRLNQSVPPFLSDSFKENLQHVSNRTMSFEKIWRFRSPLSIPIYLYNKSLVKSTFQELVTQNQTVLDQLCKSDTGGICLFMHTFLNLTITIPLIVTHLHEQGREIIGVTDEPEVAKILNGKLTTWLGITPTHMHTYCLRDLNNITKVNDVINRKGFVIMLPDRFKTDFQEPCNNLLDFSILETSPKATFGVLKDKTMGMYIKTIADFTKNSVQLFPFSTQWGDKSTPEIKLHYTPDCKDQIPDIMQSMLSDFHLGFNEWMYSHRNINQFLNDSVKRDYGTSSC
jgi:acyl carrier protein